MPADFRVEKILQKCYNFVEKVGRKEVNMEDIFMDTAKVMAKGQVTIPKRIRELLNLENGDYVTFVVNKDRVEIQNSKVFIEENIGK